MRELTKPLIFILGTAAVLITSSCSTSNTSSGSGGKVNMAGGWVGSIASNHSDFNIRTIRLNIFQNYSGEGSCFTLGGSASLANPAGAVSDLSNAAASKGYAVSNYTAQTEDPADDAAEDPADDAADSGSDSGTDTTTPQSTSSCWLGGSIASSNVTCSTATTTTTQAGILQGNQFELDIEHSSGVVMTLSGTATSNSLSGNFTSNQTGACAALNGTFKLDR